MTPFTLRRLSGSGALKLHPADGLAASNCSVVAVEVSDTLLAPPISSTLVEPLGGPGSRTPAP